MSYDSKCYGLAVAFLNDVPSNIVEKTCPVGMAYDELATQIQSTIENFIVDLEEKAKA